ASIVLRLVFPTGLRLVFGVVLVVARVTLIGRAGDPRTGRTMRHAKLDGMVWGRRRVAVAWLTAGWLTALMSVAPAWTASGATAATAANDPMFPAQWGLQRIGAPAAWAQSRGGGVRIGIVDTGVDPA